MAQHTAQLRNLPVHDGHHVLADLDEDGDLLRVGNLVPGVAVVVALGRLELLGRQLPRRSVEGATVVFMWRPPGRSPTGSSISDFGVTDSAAATK